MFTEDIREFEVNHIYIMKSYKQKVDLKALHFAFLLVLKFSLNFVYFQKIVIRATDGGTDPGTRSADTTLNVIFVPTSGDPVFYPNTYDVAFFGEYQLMKKKNTNKLETFSHSILCFRKRSWFRRNIPVTCSRRSQKRALHRWLFTDLL